MGYIEKHLLDGENVVYQTKLHWIIYLGPLVLLIIAFGFFTQGAEMAVVGVIVLAVAITMGLNAAIQIATSEFAVTNKRVIIKTGFISRKSQEILLTKLEGIEVSQGILGRIFNFGSITVSGTGGSKDPYNKITNPFEFRKTVQGLC